MTKNYQHIIPAIIIAVIAAVVAYLSFTSEPQDAFLFPKVVAVAFSILAIWNLIRAITGQSKTGDGFNKQQIINIMPGLVVAAIYALFLAKNLGFYLASTITFFVVCSMYDTQKINEIKGWIKRIIITIIFMGVMYGLFAVILKVQTPRGIWF